MRYTPWIVSEHVPDFSTLENLVADLRAGGRSGQDLAIALWQVMVDHDLGIFHYCPAQETFWGRDCHDPLKIFNVFGFTICHCHAHVLAMLGRAAGFETRIANISGHEGTEFFYDGRWHYYDADVQMFHRLHPPNQQIIASRQDTYEDPTLVGEQPNPSFPYHLPDRLPENFQRLYEVEPTYPQLYPEQVHSMDFRLRPGEEMVRYFHHRGRWVVFDNYPAMFRRWRNETGPEGPTERFWPRRQWGNGCFRYAPDLSSGSRDAERGADSLDGLKPGEAGLECQGRRGQAVFAFESPCIYCGIPDPLKRVPSADGATIRAQFDLPEGASARIEAAPEQSEDWAQLWRSEGAGDVECNADFTELADARFRLRLRFVLEGAGATLKAFETRLWFMVSPHSLPALRAKGANRMRLHSGDRFGLHTRRLMIERRTDDPDFMQSVFRAENLVHTPDAWERLTPAAPDGEPWRLLFELKAPEGGRAAWMRAFAIVEGRKPDEPDDGVPFRVELADSPDGPWRISAEHEILEHPLGWHFGVPAEGRFAGDRRAGYVRFSGRRGANGFRIAGHYVPAGEPAEPGPLEVEHAWYEVHEDVGRRLHTHVETMAGETGEYTVECAREPHNESITLRVPSTRRA